MDTVDVAIVGGGPAGSVCAARCAASGLRTVVIEKTRFPREKVCGDCLNPACWPIFDRLQLSGRVLAMGHARLREVTFIDMNERAISCPLPSSDRGEIAVKRSLLDQLLLTRAAECGATVRDGVALTKLTRTGAGDWELETAAGQIASRRLVAADGRNSTAARLLGLLPATRRDRIGVQTHFPLPASERGRVVMRFLPQGYCGLADVGEGVANLCLVARPSDLSAVQTWAARRFELPPEQSWRSITPLSREPISPVGDNLLLAGDAARVVEPFTGEGIFYALASGELAARHLVTDDFAGYAAAHARLYRGRLWLNELARLACLHPRFAQMFLAMGRMHPPLLAWMTRKVVTAL